MPAPTRTPSDTARAAVETALRFIDYLHKGSTHFAGPNNRSQTRCHLTNRGVLRCAGFADSADEEVSRRMGYCARNQVSRSVSSVQDDELVDLLAKRRWLPRRDHVVTNKTTS